MQGPALKSSALPAIGGISRAGLLYAIAACFGWGFAFVGPLILGDWPGLTVAAGRYIGYGIASVVTLWWLNRAGRARIREPKIWRDALVLTLFGNLLYYALLSVAVQKAGYVMPTLIIGLLPVTVSLAGRLRERRPPTMRYGWALLLILAGLWLAHAPANAAATGRAASTPGETLGLICAFGALSLWTVYGVLNTERLRRHGRTGPGIGGLQWSSLQGTAALPFALALFVAVPRQPQSHESWLLFLAVSTFLGLVTSWAANAFWNLSSTHIAGSLLGQMIVFETIAGILYGAIWSQAMPPMSVLAGTAVLILGVVVAVGESRTPPTAEELA